MHGLLPRPVPLCALDSQGTSLEESQLSGHQEHDICLFKVTQKACDLSLLEHFFLSSLKSSFVFTHPVSSIKATLKNLFIGISYFAHAHTLMKTIEKDTSM